MMEFLGIGNNPVVGEVIGNGDNHFGFQKLTHKWYYDNAAEGIFSVWHTTCDFHDQEWLRVICILSIYNYLYSIDCLEVYAILEEKMVYGSSHHYSRFNCYCYHI